MIIALLEFFLLDIFTEFAEFCRAKIVCILCCDRNSLSIRVFHKHTELAKLALEALLCENKKIQQWNVTPVSIEPGTSAIQV